MTRVKAIVLDGPASAATIAAIRAELDAQDAAIVLASPTVADIVKRVSFETGVSVQAIVGDRQHAPAVRARKMTMWLAYELTGRSLSSIGRVLGNRDHSTVIHGVHTSKALRQRDPAFRQVTNRIRDAFNREYEA